MRAVSFVRKANGAFILEPKPVLIISSGCRLVPPQTDSWERLLEKREDASIWPALYYLYTRLAWLTFWPGRQLSIVFMGFRTDSERDLKYPCHVCPSFCLSACKHLSARLPLEWFSWKAFIGDFDKKKSAEKSKFG
jgi:hypothetical protein